MPNTNGNLDSKVAFVTGAASGIGRATALAFARERANVVVADIDQRGNQDTVRMIEDLGGRALAVNCDVTRSEDVQSALTKTVKRFGRLDYAFNNAGAEQQPKPTADITEEEWDRIITINLRSVFLCLKYEIPLMLQHGGGAIVNTSSGAGIKVFGRGAAYAAAKHGVVGLTKDAALDSPLPRQRIPGRHAADHELLHPAPAQPALHRRHPDECIRDRLLFEIESAAPHTASGRLVPPGHGG